MEGRLPRWSRHACVIISTVISLAIQIAAQKQSGGWGPWSVTGQCSRTCGGGVQLSSRRCLTGWSSCQGSRTTYQSCNVQDCPEGSQDFREYQCAAYNGVPTSLKGRREQTYRWKPYYDPSSPCDLICENEYGDTKKLRETTIDGTRCDNAQRFGICINGFCKPTGCDHKLGSIMDADKCLVCGGNGENCRTITGTTVNQYQDPDGSEIVSFPVGATSLRIVLASFTLTSLDLKSDSGRSLPLTEAMVAMGPRKLVEFGGATFTYVKSMVNTTFLARGPINETLSLYLQFDMLSPLVEYEYSIKTQTDRVTVTPTPQRFEWEHGRWTQCSSTCGHGRKHRAVSCIDRQERKRVDGDLCSSSRMPDKRKTCNAGPCRNSASLYRWAEGRWGDCSLECGVGEQIRIMHCVESGVTGSRASVSEDLCIRYAGTKPVYKKACRGLSDDCPKWASADWSQCSVTCGRGHQTRRVTCQRGSGVVVDNSKCPQDEKPDKRVPCVKHRCPTKKTMTTTTTTTTKTPRDCTRSTFGCCPDNVTHAKGRDFQGCNKTTTDTADVRF